MNTDFSKRLDEIARAADHRIFVMGGGAEEIKSAMLAAIEEFAKLEPSEEAIGDGADAFLTVKNAQGGMRVPLIQSLPFAYRAMLAAQWKEIEEGRK
jgi:hypothetical protein